MRPPAPHVFVLGVLCASAATAGATPVEPTTTAEDPSWWARAFEIRFCPRSCAVLDREAVDSAAAFAALPSPPPKSERTDAIIARADIARRDLDACQNRAAAARATLLQQLATLDCAQVLELEKHPSRCSSDAESRVAACHAQEAETRRLEDEAALKREQSRLAQRGALMSDRNLVLVTASAALCVYEDARASVEKARRAVRSTLAPLYEEGPVPEDKRPEVREGKIATLARQTRALLRQSLKEPPLPCSDRVVAHVADCLWLDEFGTLGDDYPGALPVEQCLERLTTRANALGTLIGLPGSTHSL